MTLEELFVREYDFQKGKNEALTQELAAMDMQLKRLKETLEVYREDLIFMKSLFKIRTSSAGSEKIIYLKRDNLWEGDEGFDRLYDLCGFKEGDEDDG